MATIALAVAGERDAGVGGSPESHPFPGAAIMGWEVCDEDTGPPPGAADCTVIHAQIETMIVVP